MRKSSADGRPSRKRTPANRAIREWRREPLIIRVADTIHDISQTPGFSIGHSITPPLGFNPGGVVRTGFGSNLHPDSVQRYGNRVLASSLCRLSAAAAIPDEALAL